MHDERVEVRTVLCFEDLDNCSGIEGIRCQTVDRFGRNSNKLACFEQPASLFNIIADRCDRYFDFLLKTLRAASATSTDVNPKSCISSSGSPDPP